MKNLIMFYFILRFLRTRDKTSSFSI